MGFEGLNRTAPKKDSDLTYSDPEKGEQLLADEIASCRDFRALFTNVIDRYDAWKYSNGEPLDKTLLKDLINDVRTGRKTPDYITSRYGLRAKVVEILNEDSKQNSGNNEVA